MNEIIDLFNKSVDRFALLNIWDLWAVVAISLLICIIGLMIAEYIKHKLNRRDDDENR